jgi:hypothetical protein
MKRDVLEDDPDAEMVIPKDQRYIWRAKVPRLLCPFATQAAAGCDIVWHMHELVRRQKPFLYKAEREGYEAIGREPMLLLTRERLPPLPLLTLYSQVRANMARKKQTRNTANLFPLSGETLVEGCKSRNAAGRRCVLAPRSRERLY